MGARKGVDLSHLKPYQFSTENQPKNRKTKKGYRDWKTIYKEILAVEFDISKSEDKDLQFIAGKSKKLTGQELLAIKDYIAAVKGSDKAKDRIQNRTAGLPKQLIENINRKPLRIIYEDGTEIDLKNADNVEVNTPNINDGK